MPLSSSEDAAAVAELIASTTASRAMPPYGVDASGDCNRYTDARWLSDAQIARIAAWVEAGAVEGDLRRAGRPRPVELNGVTHGIQMPAETSPDDSLADDYRCFLLDPGVAEDAFLAAYEVLPGEPRSVHHVVLFALATKEADAEATALDAAEQGPGYTCFGGPGTGDFRFLAAWAPGTGPTVYPEGTGLPMLGGRKTVMQVHYNLAAGALADRTRVDLVIAPSVAEEAIVLPLAHPRDLELPPGQAHVETGMEVVGDEDLNARILGVYPHMHSNPSTAGV